LEEWTPPSITRDVVDVTCMEDEAADAVDADPPNYGSVQLSGFFDPDSAEDQAIQDFMVVDNISNREATIVVKFRKTGSGTPPAASTWTYNTITYTGRLVKFEPQKVKQKEKMMLNIEMKVTKKPVRS
jgi:hypothetical protein